MGDDGEDTYGNSIPLIVANVCGGLSYAFTRFGPWGQANPDRSYAGVQGPATQAEVVLFAMGCIIWGFMLGFGTYTSFEDKATQTNAVALAFWSWAFFAGRFQTFTFGNTLTLSTDNIPPGAPTATVNICTYHNINYGVADCNNLIGATVVLAILWVFLIFYYFAGIVSWSGSFFYWNDEDMLVVARTNNLHRLVATRWFRRTAECEGEDAMEAMNESDAVAASYFVNSFTFNALLVAMWLVIQAVAQSAQFFAANQPGTYLQAQVVFSDLSLAALVVGSGAFLWGGLLACAGVATSVKETEYMPTDNFETVGRRARKTAKELVGEA
jgi:hypothetical protein